MAYVALSRVRSLSGVHLTAFSPTSIIHNKLAYIQVLAVTALDHPFVQLLERAESFLTRGVKYT